MRPVDAIRSLPRAVPTLLRRARTEPGVLVVMLVAVAVTTFVFAGLPRWIEVRSDAALRDAVAEAPPDARNLQALRRSVIPPGPEDAPMGPVTGFGERFHQDLAPSIRSVIADRTWLVDSPVMDVSLTQPALPEGSPTITFPRELTLRRQQDIDDHTRIVEGRAPAPTEEVVENPLGRSFFGSSDVEVVEVALSGAALEQLEAVVGQRLLLVPDPGRCCPRPIFVDVVGELEVIDPTDPYWSDELVHEPRVTPEGDSKRVTAYAVFSEADYGGVIAALNELPMSYVWRYGVDPDRIAGGELEQLSAALRQLDARFGRASALSDVTQVQSGLLDIFEEVAAQHRATASVLTLAAIGVLTIALVVIGLAAALLAERRRPMVELLRSRGASPGQILGAHATEGLLTIAPGAILAGLAATLLIGGRATVLPALLTAGLAVAAVAVPTGAVLDNARRPLLRLRRDEVAGRRASPRRLTVEALVVVIAILGVVLVQRRGLSAAEGVDPYLTAVPVLLGLATGLIVLRLYPIPMRALAWASARRRALVLSLGLRRMIRQPGVTAAPLMVLVLAIAVAVFSSVVLRTIERRQIDASWQQVGADLRIDAASAGPLHSGVDISHVSGIDTIAPAYVEPVQAFSGGGIAANVQLLALGTQAYASVVSEMPDAPDLPPALLAGTAAGAGSAEDPIPVLVSEDWLGGEARPGDRFRMRVTADELNLVVVGTRERWPTVTPGERFVVAPLAGVDAATRTRPLRPNRLYVDGTTTTDEIVQTLQDQDAGAVVASREAVLSSVRDAPLVAGTVTAFRGAVVLAAGYAALAIALALTLTARARARDLAYLRTLGLSERQALALTAVELGPPALVAVVAGTALGIVTAHVVAPGVDLTAFVGPTAPEGLVVDPLTTGGLAGAVLLAVAVAGLAVSAATRRTDLSKTLRMGDA